MKSAHSKVHVIGAGGHAKVVISALRAAGGEVAAIYDDDPAKWGKEFMGVTIAGPVSSFEPERSQPALIAVGDNSARKRIAEHLNPLEWTTLIHPAACIDPSVEIGPGSVILACAVIQADAVIGKHCIVNSGAVIGHECRLDDFVHVSVAGLCGCVHLGEGTFVCLGSSVIPGITVGRWSVIGAGAVVIRDLEDYVEAVGVPAQVIKELVPV